MKRLLSVVIAVAALLVLGVHSVAASIPQWTGLLSGGGIGQVASMIDPGTNSIVATTDELSQLISQATAQLPDNACLQFSNHGYEVCTAYILNASIADLLPYYTFIHSSNVGLSRFVAYRLGSRYTGQAYDAIANRTASWPAGTMTVGVPDIHILSVTANLATNVAQLTTEESWEVRSESGQIVYQEVAVHHTIIMNRTPSYLLHKWVVSAIQ